MVRAGRAPAGGVAEEELAELHELARTAGVETIGELVQRRDSPTPYLRGEGKLEELKRAYREPGAEVLLVDDELDPTQQRSLENALDARVVDRTQLILDIFAEHAVSAEGNFQVELAQLEYNLPRMRGMWKHLERLGGGTGGVGGVSVHAAQGVAARDRPPPRAASLAPLRAAAEGGQEAARDEAEGARAAAGRRRSRWRATRTSASRRC